MNVRDFLIPHFLIELASKSNILNCSYVTSILQLQVRKKNHDNNNDDRSNDKKNKYNKWKCELIEKKSKVQFW